MKGKLFLIHWHETEAESYASVLRTDGWDVQIEAEDGGEACRRIREQQPDVVLLYLLRKPSHGTRTAEQLHETAATRALPLLFVDGEEDVVDELEARFPAARFTTSTALGDVLETYAHPDA